VHGGWELATALSLRIRAPPLVAPLIDMADAVQPTTPGIYSGAVNILSTLGQEQTSRMTRFGCGSLQSG
jgi:hypothetical protein